MFGEETKVLVNDIITFLNAEGSYNGGYDVVIFNDVIEHLTKPEIFEILDEVYKLLNKNNC